MNVSQRIEANFIDLSPKEQTLGTYILQKGSGLKNKTIHEMAEETAVSPATITRFCRKVGCHSFVELKMQLLQSNEPEEEQLTASQTTFQTVAQFYNRVIQRTSELLSEQAVEQLVEHIRRANRIVIYGLGSSGLTAKELAIRLSRMGLNATCETDSHLMIISSTVTQADDTVIGISNSGETKEVIYALRNAKANGAHIVSMTSMKGSTLAELAEDTLVVHSSRFVDNEQFVNTQLPLFFLIDIVTLKLLENPIFSRNMKKTIREITAMNQP